MCVILFEFKLTGRYLYLLSSGYAGYHFGYRMFHGRVHLHEKLSLHYELIGPLMFTYFAAAIPSPVFSVLGAPGWASR
jgi:hypothetical protein